MLKIHMKENIKLLINQRESTGLKYLNDSKAFIKYSKGMDDIYKNIEENNTNKKWKILIVFDDMIADMLSNIIVTELFIRERKLNIFVFITILSAPKNIRLNSTHYFAMKIPNKRKLQQIAFNYSSHIDFQDLIKVYCRTIFFFWLLILLFHQITFYVSERIF